MKKREAFTVTELLVVTAVIAILAGLILTALAGARRTARRVKCVSNLKQIGETINLYLADAHGSSRPGTYPRLVDANNVAWYEWLDRTLEGTTSASSAQREIFHCPDDENYKYTVNGLSYGLNYDPDGDGTMNVYTINDIKRKGNFILVADSDGNKANDYRISRNANPTELIGGTITGGKFVAPRHGSTANVLFADGHVESLKIPTNPANPANINNKTSAWTLPADPD